MSEVSDFLLCGVDGRSLREGPMIKGKLSGAGGLPLVLLGLSHKNLDRLKADGLNGFIRIKAADLDLPFDILITAGTSEAEMLDGLSSLVGPRTEIIIDENGGGTGG